MKQPDVRYFRCLSVLALALAGTALDAAVIYDSGIARFSPVGTQFGRINRNGVSSDWGAPKPFPGVLGAPAARAYQTVSINTGVYSFIQVNFDDPLALLFDAAYRNAFTPINSAPDYGLNINYLGDPGTSEPVGNPSFFQIVLPPNSNLVIAINEVNPGGGTGATYNLLVEGFVDASFNDVPEPATMILLASGAALLAAMRRKGTLCAR